MGKIENKSKYLGREKATRINLIFECLKNGVPYPDIKTRLDNTDTHHCNLRGECSVSTVKRVIEKLPLKKYQIEKVVEIELNSYKDKVEKHDIELICSDQEIGIIGIQVKSSVRNIERFYRKFHNDLDEAKKIITEKKLIVLNGKMEDFLIQRNFCKQFENICSHYKL